MLDMSVLKFADDDSGRWEARDFMEGLRPMEAHEARFRLQADLFLDAVEGKPCHLATLEEARDNLRVVLAAKESYATKRIIAL
jgi:predicted dehydrogenase